MNLSPFTFNMCNLLNTPARTLFPFLVHSLPYLLFSQVHWECFSLNLFLPLLAASVLNDSTVISTLHLNFPSSGWTITPFKLHQQNQSLSVFFHQKCSLWIHIFCNSLLMLTVHNFGIWPTAELYVLHSRHHWNLFLTLASLAKRPANVFATFRHWGFQ